MEMYWKLIINDNLYHMYRGIRPNRYWIGFEPDIDTENYYMSKAQLCDGTKFAVIEIKENENE